MQIWSRLPAFSTDSFAEAWRLRCLTYQRQSADFRQIYRTIVCQNENSTWMVHTQDLILTNITSLYALYFQMDVSWVEMYARTPSIQNCPCWTLLIVWDDKAGSYQNSTHDPRPRSGMWSTHVFPVFNWWLHRPKLTWYYRFQIASAGTLVRSPWTP